MDTLVMKAEDEKFVLEIHWDPDPMPHLNPRKEFDNVGTMVCWHRDYILGDRHSYSTPEDFYADLAGEVLTKEELAKKADELFTAKKTEDGTWGIYFKGELQWEYDYEDYEEMKSDLKMEKEQWVCKPDAESALELLQQSDKLVLLPLYVYDHSGMTISTSPFYCPWDSGQVGWIYCTIETAKKKLGHTDRKKIEEALKAEVKVYDQYLRGDVYGFILKEKKSCESCGAVKLEDIDACWGFFGDDLKENGMKDAIPEEYHYLIDQLEYV